jgi:hypothetical protein
VLFRILSKREKQSHYRPWQALSVPGCWSSQILRQSAQEGGKVVSPMHRTPLPPGNIPGTYLWEKLSRPQGHCVPGRIMSMKNSNDIIGNRSRDTPVCSAVPQPLHYRVPHSLLYFLIFSSLWLVTTVQFVVSHFLPAASLDVTTTNKKRSSGWSNGSASVDVVHIPPLWCRTGVCD